MTRNLPAKSGPYWWRANDRDEWEVWEVAIWRLPGEIGDRKPIAMRYSYTPKDVKEMGGQWQRSPSPDEGDEAWAVYGDNDQWITIRGSRSAAIRDYLGVGAYVTENSVKQMWKAAQEKGITCRKVKILPAEVEE